MLKFCSVKEEEISLISMCFVNLGAFLFYSLPPPPPPPQKKTKQQKKPKKPKNKTTMEQGVN